MDRIQSSYRGLYRLASLAEIYVEHNTYQQSLLPLLWNDLYPKRPGWWRKYQPLLAADWIGQARVAYVFTVVTATRYAELAINNHNTSRCGSDGIRIHNIYHVDCDIGRNVRRVKCQKDYTCFGLDLIKLHRVGWHWPNYTFP